MAKKPKESPDKEMLKTFEASGLVDYMEYLQSPKRILWTNLNAGIAKGLGLTLGMSVVIGLAAWILTMMVQLPVVGEWAQAAQDYMTEFQESTNYSDEFAQMNKLLAEINAKTQEQPMSAGSGGSAAPAAAATASDITAQPPVTEADQAALR